MIFLYIGVLQRALY